MKPKADILTSLTRISDLSRRPYDICRIPRSQWAMGDYIVLEIEDPGGSSLLLELPNGRMRGIIGGEWIIGALGVRHATLEATGSWEAVGNDLRMHVLTGAGLLGKRTSRSFLLPPMMEGVYRGHVCRHGKKLSMTDFVEAVPWQAFSTPVILFFGTSMSAGKTTSARITTHLFTRAGYRVLGAKLSGAGRFKDILAVKDAGAEAVFDFVDVGLPSSICGEAEYRKRLEMLLNRMAGVAADVAVVEIGASPLEPYNGALAIAALKPYVRFSVLSASDPYAVFGLIEAFEMRPDLVTGVASNTLAGCELVTRLSSVPALNLIDATNMPEYRRLLSQATGMKLEN